MVQKQKPKNYQIEPSFFKKNTFCPKTFPSMVASKPLTEVNKTTILQYNKTTGKYILLVPIVKETGKIYKNDISCGIDLGVRTFASIYSENATYNVCNDISKSKYIYKKHKKIDKINYLLNRKQDDDVFMSAIMKNGVLNFEPKIINIKKKNLLKGLRKYHDQIKNKIADMHFKIAHNLLTGLIIYTLGS